MVEKKKRVKQSALEPKSQKFLTDIGYIVGKSSWWQYTNFGFQSDSESKTFTPRQYTGVRKDLFGFVDRVAFKPSVVGTLYVQITSIANVSSRKVKALQSSTIDRRGRRRMILYEMLVSGNHFHIHAWKKDDEKNRWRLKIIMALMVDGVIIWKSFWADVNTASKEGKLQEVES